VSSQLKVLFKYNGNARKITLTELTVAWAWLMANVVVAKTISSAKKYTVVFAEREPFASSVLLFALDIAALALACADATAELAEMRADETEAEALTMALEALADAITSNELSDAFADTITEFADATALDEPAEAADALLSATLTDELAEDKACEDEVWIACKAAFAASAEDCAEAWATVARLIDAAACRETEATCGEFWAEN
jgi:hypothetical protein